MAMTKKMKRIEEPKMKSQRYVSYDIILEILYRLPTNSLLRFTCVSNSWKASIRSPNFISAHHQINKNISCSHLVYMQQRGPKYCILIPESSDGELRSIPFPPLRIDMLIVGSSEGLVCLRTYSDIYLWNPFIRTMKRINPAGQFRGSYKRFGFGFAPQSKDYKIVKLVEGRYLTGAEIYSLSSDSWTKIKSPSGKLERSRISSLGSRVSFEGCIYWLVHLYNSVSTILRIDLDKQKMEEMEIDTSAINHWTMITVVNGFLVLLKSPVKSHINKESNYIYKESKSGSSSWTAVRIVDLPIEKADILGPITRSGHIILERSPRRQIFACDCYYDGKDLSFRLRDLRTNVTSQGFGLMTPIKETLHLLDEGQHGLKRYGRRRKALYLLWSLDA